MVGDSDGRHSKLRRARHQPVNFASAVEQAVIGVKVKMNEVFGWHAGTILAETTGHGISKAV